jgi:hypothetical protein
MHHPEGDLIKLAWGLDCDEADLRALVPVTLNGAAADESRAIYGLIEEHNRKLLGLKKLPHSCVAARTW